VVFYFFQKCDLSQSASRYTALLVYKFNLFDGDDFSFAISGLVNYTKGTFSDHLCYCILAHLKYQKIIILC